MNAKDSIAEIINGIQRKPVNGLNPTEAVQIRDAAEDDDETKSLLSSRRGATSQNSAKPRRKVQWNDKNGNKLAEVLEYQPSDWSDSDDEEDTESCMCRIM